MSKLALSLFPLLFVASLAGCSTPYKPVEGAPAATIVVDNQSKESVFGAVFADAEECHKQHGFLTTPSSKTELRVASGKPLAFVLQLPIPSYAEGVLRQCAFVPTFVPKENQTYLAIFSRKGDTCYFNLQVAKKVGDAWMPSNPVPTIMRPWAPSKGFSDKSCRRLEPEELSRLLND